MTRDAANAAHTTEAHMPHTSWRHFEGPLLFAVCVVVLGLISPAIEAIDADYAPDPNAGPVWKSLSEVGRVAAKAPRAIIDHIRSPISMATRLVSAAHDGLITSDTHRGPRASAILAERVRLCRKALPDRCPLPDWLKHTNSRAQPAPVELTEDEATADVIETMDYMFSLGPDDRMILDYLMGDLSADSSRAVEHRLDVDTAYRNRVWPVVHPLDISGCVSGSRPND